MVGELGLSLAKSVVRKGSLHLNTYHVSRDASFSSSLIVHGITLSDWGVNSWSGISCFPQTYQENIILDLKIDFDNIY